MMKTRSSRCISSRSAWFSASRYVMIAISALSGGDAGVGIARGVDIDVFGERLERRLRALVREIPRVLDDRAHFGVDCGHLVVAPLAPLLHLRAQHRDRI